VKVTSGECSGSHHVQGLMHAYDGAADYHLADKNYFDAAYSRGYCDAMIFLLIAANPSVLDELDGQEDSSDPDLTVGGDKPEPPNDEDVDDPSHEGLTGDNADDDDPLEYVRPPYYLSYKTGEAQTFYDFDDYLEHIKGDPDFGSDVVEKAKTELAGMTDDFVPNHAPFLHVPGHAGPDAGHRH